MRVLSAESHDGIWSRCSAASIGGLVGALVSKREDSVLTLNLLPFLLFFLPVRETAE